MMADAIFIGAHPFAGAISGHEMSGFDYKDADARFGQSNGALLTPMIVTELPHGARGGATQIMLGPAVKADIPDWQ